MCQNVFFEEKCFLSRHFGTNYLEINAICAIFALRITKNKTIDSYEKVYFNDLCCFPISDSRGSG
jgi:hypothetical protein